MSVTPRQDYRFTMTSLPTMGRSKIHNNFRKPPRLPVILNKRTLYKPYTMMYDDNLVELKRMKRSELTDETRLRNKMEMDRCWRNINLSYRDHLSAMGSIRQEQSLVYHLMCKVQSDKRKIQRQTHRRHEEEFQKKMRWQRIKSMCHYVVFKFRENAKRKKEERQETDDVDSSNKQHSSTDQASSSKPQFKPHLQIIPGQDDYNGNSKYVDITDAIESGIREHIDTVEDNVSTDNFNGTANTKEKTFYSRAKSDIDLALSETIVASKDYKQYTENQSEVPDFGISQHFHEKKISQRECSEIAISEGSFLESKNNDCTSIEINYMKYKQSTETRPKIKVIEVSKNRPSKHLTRGLQNSADISTDTSSKEGSPVGTGIQEIVHTEIIMNNPVRNNVNHVSLAEHNESVYPVRTRRTGVVFSPTSFLTSDQQRIKTATRDLTVTQQMCQAANQKHKQERESLVHVMKKRARIRAKRDLDRLNNESFVKYEKTKNGLLEAYPGKRETFIPPTTKIIYNRHKLLRQERESIFLQSVKLKNFYESVVELLERPVCHQRPDAEVKERKEEMELPALQQTSSVQLTSSIFSVTQPEQVQLKEDESSRYVRVYDRDLKKGCIL